MYRRLVDKSSTTYQLDIYHINIYIYVYIYIWKHIPGYRIYVYILQEEQSLCFLKALQNTHFGHSRITFSSPFCVAGVGRSIITLF